MTLTQPGISPCPAKRGFSPCTSPIFGSSQGSASSQAGSLCHCSGSLSCTVPLAALPGQASGASRGALPRPGHSQAPQCSRIILPKAWPCSCVGDTLGPTSLVVDAPQLQEWLILDVKHLFIYFVCVGACGCLWMDPELCRAESP